LASATQQIILTPEGGSTMLPRSTGVRAVYPNIYPGADWAVVSLSTGASHQLVLRRPPASATFSLRLSAGGGTPTMSPNGAIQLDPCAAECLTMSAIVASDAAGVIAPVTSLALEDLGGGTYRLSYTFDEAWLRSPERAFPMTLAAVIVIRGTNPIYESYFKANQPGSPSCDSELQLNVGYNVDTGAAPPTNYGNTRTFLAFDLPAINGAITDARLHLFQYATHLNATSYTALLHRVSEDWVSRCASFGGSGPAFDPAALDEFAIDRTIDFKSFNFTAAAQAWAAGAPNYGLALVSGQEIENRPGSVFCAARNELAPAVNRCGTNTAARAPYIEIFYNGAAQPPPPPPPPPTPVDGTVTASLASLPANGAAVATITVAGLPAGRQVRIISSRGSLDTLSRTSGPADGAGRFVATIRSAEPGVSTITARDQVTGRTLSGFATVTFVRQEGSTRPVTPPVQQPPIEIKKVDSLFNLAGSYPTNLPSWLLDELRGFLPLPDRNTVEVLVDWKGRAPGRVVLNINKFRIAETQASGPRASLTFNLLRALPRSGPTLVELYAIGPDGSTSQMTSFTGTGWELSTPLLTFVNESRDSLISDAGTRRYNYDLANGSGQIELELRFPKDSINNLIDILDAKFGAKDVQVKSSLFIPLGDDEIAVTLGPAKDISLKKFRPKLLGSTNGPNGGSYILGRTSSSIEVKGFGRANIEPNGAVVWRAIGAQVTFTLKYKEEYSILVILRFIPGAGEALYAAARPFERPLRPFANAYWSVAGRATGEVALGLQRVELQALKVGVGGTLEVGAHVDIKVFNLDLAVGTDMDIEVSVRPPETPTFTARGYAEACWGYLFGGNECREGSITISEPKKGSGQQAGLQWGSDTQSKPYSLLGHGYAGPYAQYVGAQRVAPTAFGVLDQPFVTNVFTRTQLTAALGQDGGLASWVYDDITRPVGQNLDIAFGRWDGTTWQAPGRITNDTNLDTAPSIAPSGSRYIAAWQRIRVPAVAVNTPPQQLDPLSEIAVAVSGPGGSSWPAPTLLTNNTAVDYDPVVSGGASDDSAIVVWKQNLTAAGGAAGSPDALLASRWDGASWSAPVTLAADLAGYNQHTAAIRGSGASFVAFTEELASSTEATPVVALKNTIWNGNEWSVPVRVPVSAHAVDSPQALYLESGNPAVVYIGDRVLTLCDLTTGQEWQGPAVSSGQVRITQDSVGNIAAVWEEGGAGGLGLRASVFDAAYKLWSTPRSLTDAGEKDRFATPLLLNTGAVLVPYARTATLPKTKTITEGLSQPITVTLSVNGQTDLRALTYPLQRNLRVDATNITLSNAQPAGGEIITVTARVENVGDYAQGNILVQLFAGEPTAGGTLLASQTITAPVGAGATSDVSFLYTVPVGAQVQTLVIVVDPADIIKEANETDNIARLHAFGPDLEILTASGGFIYGTEVEFTAVVRNAGTAPSAPGTLAVFLEQDTAPITTGPLPVLAPGEVVSSTLSWDGSGLQAGTYGLVAQAIPAGGDEPVTTNNSYVFALDAGPNLMVTPLTLWQEPVIGNVIKTNVITAIVANIGPLPAQNVEVHVFANAQSGFGRLLFTRTISVLQPGATVVIEGEGSGALPCGVKVQVDPRWQSGELTRANNTALIVPAQSRCAASLYLPLIRR